MRVEGQIVHAEETHVLEALDGVALAGAAEAGDHDEGDGGHVVSTTHFRGSSRRWCEGRIPSSSRYLATVRRAMVSPRPFR